MELSVSRVNDSCIGTELVQYHLKHVDVIVQSSWVISRWHSFLQVTNNLWKLSIFFLIRWPMGDVVIILMYFLNIFWFVIT